MKNASVSKLKASLSAYLAKVKKGEEIVVTDRGHPVAKLIPFPMQGQKGSQESQRDKLIRDGIIIPGKTGRIPKKFLKPSPIKDPQGLLLKALLDEREEGY